MTDERDDGGYLVTVDRCFERQWRQGKRSIVDTVEVGASLDNEGHVTIQACVVSRCSTSGDGTTTVEEVELWLEPTAEERAVVMAALRDAAMEMGNELTQWAMGGLN